MEWCFFIKLESSLSKEALCTLGEIGHIFLGKKLILSTYLTISLLSPVEKGRDKCNVFNQIQRFQTQYTRFGSKLYDTPCTIHKERGLTLT